MAELMRSLRFGARLLRRAPGYALTAALTLALGVGATTVMFSVVSGILLRSLGVAEEERLVVVRNDGASVDNAVSAPDFADLREQTRAFDALAAHVWSAANLNGGAAPARLRIADVTSNWFTMLGAGVQLGRGLVPGEEGLGAPRIVVLSDALWRAQFAADPGIVGRAVLLDGTPHTVVGVASRDFTLPDRADLWRPMRLLPDALSCRGCPFIWGPVGRLKAGVSLSQARHDVQLAVQRLHAQYATAERGRAFDVVPLREHVVGGSRTTLLVLFGAAGCLLLVACVNLAMLQLLRASSRSSEIGVRLAFGATRRQLFVQLLSESLLLALVGGVAGLVLALLGIHVVRAIDLGTPSLLAEVVVDWRVLAFACAVTVSSGILFGLAPALQRVGANGFRSLTSGTRGASRGKTATRIRNAFIIAELALAIPLVISATLLGRTLANLVAIDPGFRPEQVVRFDLTLPQCGTTWVPAPTCEGVQGSHYGSPVAIRNFTSELLARLRALPGTRAVAVGFGVPFTKWAQNRTQIRVEGQDDPRSTEVKYVSLEYFDVLRIPVLRGRGFSGEDRPDGRKVAVVNKAFADAYLPDQDPVGRTFRQFGRELEIVGVVGDTKTLQLGVAPEPAVYGLYEQWPSGWITVLVRSSGDAGAVMAAARAQLASLDPMLPPFNMMRMEDAVASSVAVPRFAALVVTTFAGAALLLAAVGVYGLVAFALRERRRELGIRVALGARHTHIVGDVLAWGARLAVAGSGLGFTLSVIASRTLQNMLFGVEATDVTTYAGVCAVLLVVTLFAAWLPARLAWRADPTEALRAE